MSVLLPVCLLLSVAPGPETASSTNAPVLSGTWQVTLKNHSLDAASGKDLHVLRGYGANLKNGGAFAGKKCGVQPAAFEEPEATKEKRLLENELLFERSIQNGLKRLLGIDRITEQQLAVLY